MTVDYLRTCYRSKILIDASKGTLVAGRFYRPPDGAQVYTAPTVFRSAMWLDPWDRDFTEGDTLEGFSYDKGTRNFFVAHDLRQTRLAQVGCDKSLTLVPGSLGFPLRCRPVGGMPASITFYTGYSFWDSSTNMLAFSDDRGELDLVAGEYVSRAGDLDSGGTITASVIFDERGNPFRVKWVHRLPLGDYGIVTIRDDLQPEAWPRNGEIVLCTNPTCDDPRIRVEVFNPTGVQNMTDLPETFPS